MKYIEQNGRNVSVIGVGCMRIADMSAYQAEEFIKGSLDAGINFFDHADIYGGGQSENIFGEVISSDTSLREKMFIQSKCAIHDGLFDFSKEYILKSVDGILERLHTDHIDSLLLHRPDVLMEPEEVDEAFDELKKAGKVLSFGVSNQNRFQMELLSAGVKEPLWTDQLQMSIAHTPMIDAGLNVDMHNDAAIMRDGGTIEYLRLKKMTLQIWSPLQKGYFNGVFLNDPEYVELNDKLNEIAGNYGVSPSVIAYAWLLRLPMKVQVILGTTKTGRLQEAAKASDIQLSRSEWYDLYKAAGNRLP